MDSPRSMQLDDILEQCLNLIERGASIENCVARFPSHADELHEILSLSLELNAITPPLMTRSQIQRMQYDILDRIDSSSSWWGRLVSWQFILASGAVAATFIIVAVLVFTLNRDQTSEEAVVAAVSASPETEMPNDKTEEPNDIVTAVALNPTVNATEVPTETEISPSPTDIPSSETATIESIAIEETETIESTISDTPTETEISPSPTDIPPSATATIESVATEEIVTITVEPTTSDTPTEEPYDEVAALPIYIDYAGEVGGIDDENGQIKLGEITIALSEDFLESVDVGDYVVVSGLLEDDGSLDVDVVEATTADVVEEDSRECESDDIDKFDGFCHPVLLILSDAFDEPYHNFAALQEDGFGVGEISRLYVLSEESDTNVAEIIQLRRDGLSWAEMIAVLRGLSPSDLASGIIIGNGRGQTIRPIVDGARVYSNTSDDGSQDSQGGQTIINTPIPTVNTLPPPRVDTPVPPVVNTSPPVATSPPDSVTICHSGNTIVVDWDAWVNAHSKHGDTLGACE